MMSLVAVHLRTSQSSMKIKEDQNKSCGDQAPHHPLQTDCLFGRPRMKIL